jgi:lipopolysaccharide exporter
MGQSLASKAISGLKWNTISTIANAVMQIGYTSIMARLLDPEAFGLVAISIIILQFGGYFANMGLNKALIQIDELKNEHIRAAFTSSFLLGLVFTGLVWALAPLAAQLFKNPDVAPVVRVMSLTFLVNGMSATAFSLLERNMRFKAISILETSSYVISYLGIGVLLAYLDFGVYSLIIASLSQATIVGLSSYAIVRHNIVMLFKWSAWKPLFSYGSKMSVNSLLEWFSASLPSILIGRLLGDYKLGIYDRAHKLVSLPMYMLTRTISKVIFPSFSKMQSDNEKLGKVYLSSITLVIALVIPACAGIFVAAPELVYVLLGKQWGESVPILQILSFAVAINLITMFAGIICDAKAALNSKIVLNIVFVSVLGILMFSLKGFGLQGFAMAFLLAELVRTLFYQRAMHKILILPYRQQLSVYLPGIINGAVIGVLLYLFSSFLRTTALAPLLILVAQVITGAILLAILSLLFPHKILKSEIQAILTKTGLSDKLSTRSGRAFQLYKSYILNTK